MPPSFLDKLEDLCSRLYEVTWAQRSAIRGILGYVLLFNSGQYLGIVLLMQGVKVAGLSIVDQSLNELYCTYVRTRVAVKEAMPDASALLGLQQKLSNAARDLKTSKITAQDYERMNRDMEELQEALKRSQTFVSTISTAVDPNKLSEIFGNLHVFLLSVTAIATSTSAATVTIGLNIGKVLSERSYSVLLQAREMFTLMKTIAPGAPPAIAPPAPAEPEKEWLRSAFHMAGNSIGLTIAYMMQKTAVTFGGCMMGSDYLLASFEDLMDPLLSRVGLPQLKRNATAKLLIQGSMVSVGFYCQMRGLSIGTNNMLMRAILSPIVVVEACVQAYVLAALLKND